MNAETRASIRKDLAARIDDLAIFRRFWEADLNPRRLGKVDKALAVLQGLRDSIPKGQFKRIPALKGAEKHE